MTSYTTRNYVIASQRSLFSQEADFVLGQSVIHKMQNNKPLCSEAYSSGSGDHHCPMQREASLREYFGFTSCRKGQQESALCALHGKDVFACMYS